MRQEIMELAINFCCGMVCMTGATLIALVGEESSSHVKYVFASEPLLVGVLIPVAMSMVMVAENSSQRGLAYEMVPMGVCFGLQMVVAPTLQLVFYIEYSRHEEKTGTWYFWLLFWFFFAYFAMIGLCTAVGSVVGGYFLYMYSQEWLHTRELRWLVVQEPRSPEGRRAFVECFRRQLRYSRLKYSGGTLVDTVQRAMFMAYFTAIMTPSLHKWLVSEEGLPECMLVCSVCGEKCVEGENVAAIPGTETGMYHTKCYVARSLGQTEGEAMGARMFAGLLRVCEEYEKRFCGERRADYIASEREMMQWIVSTLTLKRGEGGREEVAVAEVGGGGEDEEGDSEENNVA